ncbi:DUF7619 domain-containing protein [Spirosoma jeollabukense]
MKYSLLVILSCFCFCTFAQTVKRAKTIPEAGVNGTAYHPNVGLALIHGGDHIGFPAQNAQVVDKLTSEPLSTEFPFLPEVKNAIADGKGGWYVSGNEFRNSVDQTRLAKSSYGILHIYPDNRIDTTFRIPQTAASLTIQSVRELILYKNTIYCWAQVYTNSISQYQLLGFDAISGSFLWNSNTASTNLTAALSLLIADNKLFLCGEFTKINGANAANRKAIAYNLIDGQLTSWNPSPLFSNTQVADFTVSGNKIILAIKSPSKLIAVDQNAGSTTIWQQSLEGTPLSIAATENDLFVVAEFYETDGITKYSKIGRYLTSNGMPNSTWTIQTGSKQTISKLVIDDSDLYAFGKLVSLLGVNTKNVAKVNINNRTVQDWKPFNTLDDNKLDQTIYTLVVDGQRVFIGGRFINVKQLYYPHIAIVRPESERVVDWKPSGINIEYSAFQAIAFENDSTLWTIGTLNIGNNQSLPNSLAAFSVKTGSLLRRFTINTSNQTIRKLQVKNGVVAFTTQNSSVAGSSGNLKLLDTQTGAPLSWFTPGNVSQFELVDSLLYLAGNVAVNGVYTSTIGKIASIDLNKKKYSSLRITQPAWRSDFSILDFTITGNSILFSTYNSNDKAYYQFDRFTGHLIASFGSNSTDQSQWIMAAEKYLFLAGSPLLANNFAIPRCGRNMTLNGLQPTNTSAFYYDLEYKRFSDSCFYKTSYANTLIKSQLFLAQSFLYFNIDWSGDAFNKYSNHANFLRVSFPRGFFKDEINPAFFPKSGGNGGQVTVNFYGYSIVAGSKVRLKKTGQADIVVPDSLLKFPENFRMEAQFDLRNKALGSWDVEVLLPSGVKLFFPQGFDITTPVPANIKVQITTPPAIRPGRPTRILMTISNKGGMDAYGVPLWIVVSRNTKIVSPSVYISDTTYVRSDTTFTTLIDSLLGEKFTGNGYWFLLSKIKSGETLDIPLEVQLTGRERFEIHAFANQPMFTDNDLNQQTNGSPKGGRKSTSPTGFDCFIGFASEIIPGCPGAILKLTNSIYRYSVRGIKCESPFIINLAASILKTGVECTTPNGVFERRFQDFFENSFTGPGDLADISQDCHGYIMNRMKQTMGGSPNIASYDPNDKLGPVGVKAQRFVNMQTPFNYLIRFENFASATADAQLVRLVDTLSKDKYDLSTLQLGYFNIADTTFYIPPGKKHHVVDWDLRPSKNLIVRMEATFIDSTGVLIATYTSLDPSTMKLTEDPILGFLPPNKLAREGEGGLSFNVEPKATLPNLATLRNTAYIYFDGNPVIPTPPWTNIIDSQPPTSAILTLPTATQDTTFTLRWQGSDNESGVNLFDIYVAVNNSPYKLFLQGTSSLTATFTGKMDSTYSFYSVAYDSLYNQEAAPVSYDKRISINRLSIVRSLKTGDWNSVATWDCNCVPSTQHTVTISSGHKVTITPQMGPQEAKKLVLESGGTLNNMGLLRLIR